MDAYKLFCEDCQTAGLWIILLFFPPDSPSSPFSETIVHPEHTHSLSLSPSQLWLTETSFSQAGGTSVFNPNPLLQNTENICRGSRYFLNVFLNAPQQSVHPPARLYTVYILQALIIAGDMCSAFFIWLSNHQNFISNIFLLVKTGSELTRGLTSVRMLSLCWEAKQAFFFLSASKLLIEVKSQSQQNSKKMCGI